MKPARHRAVYRAKTYDVILTCNYSPWSSYSGGGQKSTHMVACALVNLGYSVCVVYSKGLFESIIIPDVPYDIEWAPFVAIRPGISSVFRYLNGATFYSTVQCISTAHSIIHSNGDEGSLLGRIPTRRRFIYTNRYPGFDPFLFERDWTRISTWIAVSIREPRFSAMSLGMISADAVTCTSQHSIDQVKRCFSVPPHKLWVVPNGLDPDFANAIIPNFTQQRGVMFYGRLTQAKGVDILIDAYAQLPGSLQQTHPLSIVGEGPLEKKLRQRSRNLNVSFIKWKTGNALIRHIQDASVVVLPSLEESFGNTMIETLALGQRLITTNCGSIPEVTGKFGIKLSSLSATQLSMQLHQVLNAPVNTAKQIEQQNTIRNRYSWAATAKRFSALYENPP